MVADTIKTARIIACFVLTALLAGCTTGGIKDNVMVNQPDDNKVYDVMLNFEVTEKGTNEPVENAAVYLGGYYRCYTDSEGRCSIKHDISGSYGLETIKKGYSHFSEGVELVRGENNFNISIEKQAEAPIDIVVEGKVTETVTLKGTKSENHLIKIRTDDGKEEYLFNELGLNTGFSDFIGKSVAVNGYWGKGHVGWQRSEADGIYVESIEKI